MNPLSWGQIPPKLSTALGMAVALSLSLCISLPAMGQDPDAGTGMEARVIAELSSADGAIVPSLHQSVLRTRDGAYLISHHFADAAVVVYGPGGEFRDLYDRRGDGPGELRTSPRLFAGPEGSVYLWDMDCLHAFGPSFNHLRTVRLERRIWSTAAVLPDGRVVVDDQFPMEGGTVTVSLLDHTGAFEAVVEQKADPIVRTRIVPARDGGFWTLLINGTTLRKYSPAGQVERSLDIEGGVVAPWAELVDGEGFHERPRPRHEAAVQLADGTLLVVAWVADGAWEPAEDPMAVGGGAPSEIDGNRIYDTVIERVGAATGTVMDSVRVPYPLQPVHGAPGLFHSRHPADMGHVVTRIWEVEGAR